ncbi:hypothetical protein [Treponema sp. Marseille-Q4130]|uniref:hypothetical protein n=1 Tax=Treponema sp. Marseille-Q4130 TaxID=2766702 RepID=UPI00165202E9|nr:hypothetical protein [Treponema sp. Marseille-Q4130]MBC6721337.1 hypothetical protein [Treponema sp. Marseille-Q4130]
MTVAVIGIAAAVVMAAFAGSAFYLVHIERRARKNIERKNAEILEHEREMANSIADANAKKEELQSGNSRDDFSAGIDLLHKYAKNKR